MGDEGRFAAAHTMAAVIYVDCWPSSVGRRGKPLLTSHVLAHKTEAESQDNDQTKQAMTEVQ